MIVRSNASFCRFNPSAVALLSPVSIMAILAIACYCETTALLLNHASSENEKLF
jgi:hypothetical protein